MLVTDETDYVKFCLQEKVRRKGRPKASKKHKFRKYSKTKRTKTETVMIAVDDRC